MTAKEATVELADVVVVGGGGAGLAAAIEAASCGGSVVLLEKSRLLGGTTALSVGSITASVTMLQRRAGIVDSVDEHFVDMGMFAGEHVERDNLALRRLYVERSGETLEWLRRHGLVFVGPMAEPPHRRARMHNVLPGSRAYIDRLSRAARRLGVDIRTRTVAVQAVVTDGRVTAVRCRGSNGEYELHTRHGVILAAGDFSASADLKARYLGPLEAEVAAVNERSTGDGIKLGLDAGGMVLNGDLALGPEIRFVPPQRKKWMQRIPPYRVIALAMRAASNAMPDFLTRRAIMAFATTYLAPSVKLFELGAVLVDGNGDRFCDELDSPANDLARQSDGVGWIVLDSVTAARLEAPAQPVSTAPGIAYAYLKDYRNSRKDLYHRADSLPGLAKSIGVAADRLVAAVSQANADREPDRRCQRPPFVALGPVRSWIVLTEGGLAIDETCRVLDTEDRPIEGLFAAGSNGQGGLLLEGHGNHLGWAFVSGRIAGRSAMATPAGDLAEER